MDKQFISIEEMTEKLGLYGHKQIWQTIEKIKDLALVERRYR